MFVDEYPYLNNSTSYIVDEDVDTPPSPPNPNSIIIYGTAEKGPMYTPILMNDTSATDTFGDHIDDAYGDAMLIKGYKEAKAMYTGAQIYGLRIGDASRASLDLYEHQQYTSGDYSPTDVTACMRIESKSDGDNDTEVNIYADPSGYPTAMDVTMPDGVTLNYQLDIENNVPGAYNRVSDIVSALNNNTNFSTVNVAKVNVLTAEVDVPIVESSSVSGEIQITYDIESGATESYGDKLIEILSAYRSSDTVDSTSVESGDTSSTLTSQPDKDSDPNTATIDHFSVIKSGETVLEASASDIGTKILYLDCKEDDHWDKTHSTYNIHGLTLTRVRSGATTTLEEGVDFTIDKPNAKITLTDAVQLGDKFYADYKYRVIFVEANVRSDLQSGNRYSYFVYGSDIIFGAGQQYNLELRYTSNSEYTIGSDIIITDADSTTIKFVNSDNEPSIGDTVTFVLVYEPELPASTGTAITDAIVQESQLTGGSDGRAVLGLNLYNELQKGYEGAENIPARYLVPMGVALDEVVEDVDYETGLPTTVNAGFLTQLSTYVLRKSKYVSECFGIISPQIITADDINNPKLTEVQSWFTKLTTVSATDTARAANQVVNYDDYHIIVPVSGGAIFQIPGIKGGASYVGQFNVIHAAIMQNMNKERAIVNMNINPGPIQRFIYPIMNNEWINKINKSKYTLYTQSSVDGAYTIVDSPTLARSTSKFDRQFVTQTVFDVIQYCRRKAKPFFGQPNSPSIRKSLETTLQAGIADVFQPDRISGIAVTVYSTDQDKIDGKTQVILRIITSKEIRKIQFTTRLELV